MLDISERADSGEDAPSHSHRTGVTFVPLTSLGLDRNPATCRLALVLSIHFEGACWS